MNICRSQVHETIGKTNKVTRKKEYVPADPHITLFLGHNINDLKLEGHTFVHPSPSGGPGRIMEPKERDKVDEGRSRVSSEFYITQPGPLLGARVPQPRAPKLEQDEDGWTTTRVRRKK